MRKIIYILLFATGFINAQVVNIPDANFKAKLLEASPTNNIAYGSNGYIKIDVDDDGEIQLAEAQQVDSLNIMVSEISDLEGIASFTALKGLICFGNSLTALDVSACTNLVTLNCSDNNISTFNFTGLTNLKQLNCGFNQMSAFDATGLSALEYLNCESNQMLTLTVNGLSNLSQLNCNTNELSSLVTTGLTGILNLQCHGNNLTALNLSGNTTLGNLNCNQNQLTSLDISGLANLSTLNCSINQLASLDLTGVNGLNDLGCSDNLLVALDVSMSPNLTVIYCGNNALTSLNVSGLTNLVSLNCENNDLPQIDLTGMSNLLGISIYDNQLTTIDFSDTTLLTSIVVNDNQLAELDVSALPNLFFLNCGGNQLTALDLSSNPLLTTLDCYLNNLTYINIKNGAVQVFNENFNSNWSENFDLAFVCVDEGEMEVVQDILNFSFLPYVNVNSYCSFLPGGDFNTIGGTFLFDGNNNGCDDNDEPQPFIKLNINDGTVEESAFSNIDSDYAFYTEAGSFTITPELENPTFFNVNPTSAVINFPLLDNSVSVNDFCITANGIHPDLEIVIVPIVPAQPGFMAIYKLVYRNKGNQLASGDITFTFNDAVLNLYYSNPLPTVQATGSFTYSYSNLIPFESNEINIIFNVNAPTDTPAVNIDDVFVFTATINPVVGDEIPGDNVFTMDQIVVGSYDPNDKQCIEGDVVAPDAIGEYLHYLIRFENTGTAPAQNIVVKDVIDEMKFDVSSLRVMNSSHPVEARIKGNVAEFIFKNIYLDTNGHGNILLKVQTKENLVVGDVVTNKADIFFDYNFPIITNNATTTFQNSLGVDENNTDRSIVVYPNPTNHSISIKADSAIKAVQLYDVQGRILMTHLGEQTVENFDLSSYASGIYYLRVATEKGMKTEKIIKE